MAGVWANIFWLGVLVLLGWGMLRAVDKFKARRPKPSGKPTLMQDLGADWEAYRAFLNRKPPTALVEWYMSDRTSGFYRHGDDLEFAFKPVEASEPVGFGIVPIATSISGDPIFLKPGPREKNAVYLVVHDNPDEGVIKLADDVADFIDGLTPPKPSIPPNK